MPTRPWKTARLLGKKGEIRGKLLKEQKPAFTEKLSTNSKVEEGAIASVQVSNTQYLFFFKWTLKTLHNYLNPGIHTVFPLASSDGFLFWHVAVRRKMCSHDTGVDCSCLMIVTSSSQCSLTNVCNAASSAALVFNIPGWCWNVPPSDRVVLMKSVRNGDHSAKYLSDFSEKPQDIHPASNDIQGSHVASAFIKLKRHGFLTARWSIADFFWPEKPLK